MKRDYLSEKAAKKRTTNNGLWFLFIFLALFIIVIIRIAVRSGSSGGFFTVMPSGGDAYEMAKHYIRPSLKSPDVDFADEDYQCDKISDSVYVVRSYFETKQADSAKVKTTFAATLKYNGGSASNDRNWTMLNLEEH
jgi:hypothetical protein